MPIKNLISPLHGFQTNCDKFATKFAIYLFAPILLLIASSHCPLPTLRISPRSPVQREAHAASELLYQISFLNICPTFAEKYFLNLIFPESGTFFIFPQVKT